jgi:UDP-2-acetamido-3-amino-2,3-dideoxy-glucuronate N-acetyltransferase
MKLAIIGGGYWGKNLINEFNNCGVLNSICEINTELIKKYNLMYPNVKITNKFEDILIDESITAVCIALPVDLHYYYAKLSLLADKDVYVEKPITLLLNEAEDLINIAKEKSKILMVGHILHYHPCIEKIKEFIKNNKIGKIKNIISNRFNLGIFRKQENVLWSFATHDISVILSLCNNEFPTSVICNGKDHITKNIHDITNSIIKYDDKYININVNWLNPYKEQKLIIVGEKGMLLFDDIEQINKLKFYPEYITFSSDINSHPQPVKNNEINIEIDMSKSPLLKECEHFVDCCINRKTPLTDGEEGLRVLKILNYLNESLITNKEVILEPLQKKNIFIHNTATVDTGAIIGEGTKIWHYSHICKGAQIGKNCNIGQNVFISDGAIIGDYCKVQNNVSIYNGVEAADYVFFGPSCVLTNDINPRGLYSKNGEYIKTKIEVGVTLGANSTIVCGTTLGKHSLIGAGTLICNDVEPYSIIVGNPGKKIGKIDEKGNRTYKKNVLITGITGSLGRELCKELLITDKYNIYGIYNSENKYAYFKRNILFKDKDIICFKINIESEDFKNDIDYILNKNKIDYVFHCAAMKHVDICEFNIIKAIKTNIIASEIIVKSCKLHNIKNFIGLSTDKSIEPCNIYGYSKLIMQKNILYNEYSVYQGANFFFSDGSVLDIWMKQMSMKQKLTVTNLEHKRYFNTLNYVSKLLIENIDKNNKIILPDHVYLIIMKDLLDAFMEFFNYYEYIIIESNNEKIIEDIDNSIKNIILIDKLKIKDLIKEYLNV